MPRRFQEVKQELQLFLRSWLVCYPDPDLMFRLAVTSWDLQCVTHAEDTQTGSRARRSVDTWSSLECMRVSSFVFSPINSAISRIHSHVSELLTKPASGLIFCCSRARGQWRPYWLGNGMFELGVFRNTSVSALRLLSVRTDPYIYFQNAPPSLCLPLPLLSSSANSQHQNNRGRTEMKRRKWRGVLSFFAIRFYLVFIL